MIRLRNSRHIRVGNSPKVFESLGDPQVMAVVVPEVWSPESLAFADREAMKVQFNPVGSGETMIADLPPSHPLRADPIFNRDQEQLKDLFAAIGMRLLGRSDIADASRVEPAIGLDTLVNAGKCHVDEAPLNAIAVAGGITPRFLRRMLKGRFTAADPTIFEAHDPRQLETEGVSLPRGAALIYKGARCPGMAPGLRGLLHWRDNHALAAWSTTMVYDDDPAAWLTPRPCRRYAGS